MYLSYEMLMTICQAQIVTLDGLLPSLSVEEPIGPEANKASLMGDDSASADPKTQMNNYFGQRVMQINKPYCLKKKVKAVAAAEQEEKDKEVPEVEASDKVEDDAADKGFSYIVYHLSDLECIYVSICRAELDKNENAATKIDFPNVSIDIKEMTGYLLAQPD